MSPLKIIMLLHYYGRTNDYASWAGNCGEPGHARSPAVREAMESFVTQGLLECKFNDISFAITKSLYDDENSPYFLITDKGRAMVEHLCAVQVPICKWVQP